MVEFLINLGQSPLSLAIATSSWAVPAMQSIHILSIAVIFISVLVIGLRVLGVIWTDQSLGKTVDRFAPWAWVSLAVLAITGIVLIAAEPLRQIMALSFWLKMILLAVAITVSVRFLKAVRTNPAYADLAVPVDSRTRTRTIATLAVWVAIIFLGRFIAYDPLVWGPLSPFGNSLL